MSKNCPSCTGNSCFHKTFSYVESCPEEVKCYACDECIFCNKYCSIDFEDLKNLEDLEDDDISNIVIRKALTTMMHKRQRKRYLTLLSADKRTKSIKS